MRTKTLLLTAAITAAGIASSMAQVFSVNVVGYVNTTLPPKFSLVSNPLKASDNTISKLFKNMDGGVPSGLQIYKFNGTGFDIATYDDLVNDFEGTGASKTLVPGEGVFVRNPGTTAKTVTFVGEVEQGTLTVDLPRGLSVRSSRVPQEIKLSTSGFPAVNGDQVYKFNTTKQGYDIATYDDLVNAFDNDLSFGVGEAFFVRKAAAGTWTRTFNVQ